MDGPPIEQSISTVISTASSAEKPIRQAIEPRAISKKTDPDGRAELAKLLVATREGMAQTNAQIAEAQSSIDGSAKNIADKQQQLAELNRARAEKQGQPLTRLKNKIGVNDPQVTQIEFDIASIKHELSTQTLSNEQQERLLKELKEKEASDIDPKDMLQAYYEKIASTPMTNEEKRVLLTTENLASLTTDEYIALWRRLNPYFLSHVTRQGFRRNVYGMYHESGKNEFHDGFTKVCKKRELQSQLALLGLERRDVESIQKFLENSTVLGASDEEEARRWLNTVLDHHLGVAPAYPNRTSVHFAANAVSDRLYGAEPGNQIAFIYPADALASQHNFSFNGNNKDLTMTQGPDTQWNDVFVWPDILKGQSGLSIDAGIVFLPRDAKVDPETGSKYASQLIEIDGVKKRVMVTNDKSINSFKEWILKVNDDQDIQAILSKYKETADDMIGSKAIARGDACTQISDYLIQMGFDKESALDLSNIFVVEYGMFPDADPENVADKWLDQTGARWKRAENAVTAKEYWDNYFKQHPEECPKHVVFYNGDPTSAIYRFQQENNIGSADTKDQEGPLLGFDDHHVQDMNVDSRVWEGYTSLKEQAQQIIHKHFAGDDDTKS